MRRLFYAILLLIIFSFNPSTNAQSKDTAPGKGLLWRVKSQTATAYILGSAHYLKKENYPLNSKIEDAFNKSGVLAVEADISNVSTHRAECAAFLNSSEAHWFKLFPDARAINIPDQNPPLSKKPSNSSPTQVCNPLLFLWGQGRLTTNEYLICFD